MGVMDNIMGVVRDPNYGAAPPQQASPNANTVGGRTGISAYNNIGIPDYKNPYDVEGFKGSKYYGLATGDSMSPWSKLAAEQQKQLAAQQSTGAKAQAQGTAATTASNLARQGGATSGALERTQEQAGKNVLSMVQGAHQAAGNNIADIQIEDAKQRMGMLGDATGKVTNMAAKNIEGTNQYNQNIMDMLNKAVGTNQTVEAQRQAEYDRQHSGFFGGGGFLGLGI